VFGGGEAAGVAIDDFADFSRNRVVRRTHPKSAMAMSLTLYSRPLTVSMLHIAVGAAIFADVKCVEGVVVRKSDVPRGTPIVLRPSRSLHGDWQRLTSLASFSDAVSQRLRKTRSVRLATKIYTCINYGIQKTECSYMNKCQKRNPPCGPQQPEATDDDAVLILNLNNLESRNS
jgi:hypothetical protein